jgi:chromosome partitioning protein
MPAPSGDVSQSCGEGDKAQNRSNGMLGKLTPTIKVLKSVVHQKQVIADSSGQAATVWDSGGQPASYSGKEYSRLFKEIMGVVT